MNGTSFSLGIHWSRDIGGGSQGSHQQFVRIGAGIITRNIGWFVGLEYVWAKTYVPDVLQRLGVYRYSSGHSLSLAT